MIDGLTVRFTRKWKPRWARGHKRKKGSKVHVAVDTLGHLLALKITPANEQSAPKSPTCWLRCKPPREKKSKSLLSIKVIRERTGRASRPSGIRLVVVKLQVAKRGFILLPRRWVVERSSGSGIRGQAKNPDRQQWPASSPKAVAALPLVVPSALSLSSAPSPDASEIEREVVASEVLRGAGVVAPERMPVLMHVHAPPRGPRPPWPGAPPNR